MTVAHVTTIAASLKVLLLNQLCAIRREGFEVVGVSAPGAEVRYLEEQGIRHCAAPFVRATGLTPLSDLRTFTHLVRLFRRERFTIVHTHTAKADLYASLAARVAGVPIVVSTLHGFYFHDQMPSSRRLLYSNLARIGMLACDAVMSQNPEDVDVARAERICAPDKIEYLGNGIDLSQFDPRSIDSRIVDKARAELGVEPGAPVVGYVGRLVEEKGVLELMEAFRRLRPHFPDARLLLVGMFDMAKRDAIRRGTAQRFGIEDSCIFAGHRDDVPSLYRLMDICVLPSHREGFPRTPMEASSMGVPVVATNVRGCRTAVEHGRNGLLVPVRDAAALADTIGDLLADPAHRARLGSEGQRIARDQFDERRVFATVLACYERLLRRNGAAAPPPPVEGEPSLL